MDGEDVYDVKCLDDANSVPRHLPYSLFILLVDHDPFVRVGHYVPLYLVVGAARVVVHHRMLSVLEDTHRVNARPRDPPLPAGRVLHDNGFGSTGLDVSRDQAAGLSVDD